MSILRSLRPINALSMAALLVLPCLAHAQTTASGNGASLQAGALSMSAHVSNHHFNGLQVSDAERVRSTLDALSEKELPIILDAKY